MTDQYIGKEFSFTIDRDIPNGHNNLATVSTAFQAIWGVLLQRYNNTNDVVYGSVMSGRHSEIRDIENMVGLFICTVPVRVQCSESLPFSELLCKMQETAFASEKYSYCSLSDLHSTTE